MAETADNWWEDLPEYKDAIMRRQQQAAPAAATPAPGEAAGPPADAAPWWATVPKENERTIAPPPEAAAAAEAPGAAQKFLYGVTDPVRGASQLAAHAGVTMPVFGPSEFGGWSPDVEQPMPSPKDVAGSMDKEEQRYEASRKAGGDTGTDWWRLSGNLASPMTAVGSPVGTLPTVLGKGAAAGGLSALTAPVNTEGMSGEGDYWNTVGRNFGMGTGLGAVANAAVKPVTGGLTAVQQALKDAGVWLSPGAAGGKFGSAVEDLAASFKPLRGLVQSGANKMFESFNRAVHDDVLKPIGEKLPEAAGYGQKAWEYTSNAFHDYYEKLLGKVQFTPGQTFTGGLDTIRNTILPGMSADMRNTFEDYIRAHVIDPIRDAGGTLGGDAMKRMETTLRTYADSFTKRGGQEGQLGQAVDQVRDVIRAQLRDNHPELANSLDLVDRGYARLMTIAKAGKAAINNDGIFTPTELARAIGQGGNPLDVLSGKRGGTLSDLARAGQEVIGSRRRVGGGPASGPDVMVADILAHHLTREGAAGSAGLYAAAGAPGYEDIPEPLKYIAGGLLALPVARRAGTQVFGPGGVARTVAGRALKGAPLAVPGLLGAE